MTLRSVIIIGVAGVGKTEVARNLSKQLGLPMIEADEHHSESNLQKMASGQPLDDNDRAPWLARLNALLRQAQQRGEGSILACSALKRSYRRQLSQGLTPPPLFIHLVAPFQVVHQRMQRRDHFMPASLLQSQFDTLEPPGPDEQGMIQVDSDQPIDQVVAAVRTELQRS